MYHNMNVSHIEQLKETHVVYTCALDVWWVAEVWMHATTHLENIPFKGKLSLSMYYLTVASPTNYVTLK